MDFNCVNLIQKLTKSWAEKFIPLFKSCSTTELKLPKLYSWIYHTSDLIKKYGCLNGFSTKTYKSLYRDFVKILYYLTKNKILKIKY